MINVARFAAKSSVTLYRFYFDQRRTKAPGLHATFRQRVQDVSHERCFSFNDSTNHRA